MATQFSIAHIEKGLLVKTLMGEHDTDHNGEERNTAPGTWGLITDNNHADHWDVIFPGNGAWVVITTGELLDPRQYKLMPASDAAQAMQRIEALQQWLLDYDRNELDAPQGDESLAIAPTGDNYNDIHQHTLAQLRRVIED